MTLPTDEAQRPVLCRHADVVAAANDPATFSSAVSRFLQVPNGLDGEAHRAARELLDPFFAPDRMAAVEPVLREVATRLVSSLPFGQPVDAVDDVGARFAVHAQSAWLGWPAGLAEDLLAWMDDNRAATRSGDLERTTEVADRFDALIRSLVAPRRAAGAPHDLTTELVQLRDAEGHLLSDEVLVSVLRNWTGGDLGSLALCTGVVAHWLATHPEHQDELASASDAELVAAIDEILRMDDPFVSNRRVTTAETVVGGVPLPAGEQVVLHWTAANRDPEVFGDPDRFDPHRNAAANLVYGVGPHVCPGRPLATLELRVLTRELLTRARLEPAAEPAEREQPPLGGFARVPLVLRRRLPAVAGEPLLATVITVSDEVAAGLDADRGGPVAEALLTDAGCSVTRTVVPDDEARLEAAITAAIDAGARFVMTCGGTGIGPRDRTPEVVRRLLSFEMPGIAEEIRRRGIAHAKPALVSREVAGAIVPASGAPVFVVAAPGSRGGVRDALEVVGPVLGYVIEQLDGAGHV